MENTKHWLQEGEQTKITPEIEALVNSLRADSDFETIIKILEWIRDNLKYYPNDVGWNQHFRNQTAEEILKGKMSSGCSDTVVIFCALSRSLNVPTIYIEAIFKTWLETTDTDSFKNHNFAKVYIKDTWYIVDPTWGNIGVQEYKRVFHHTDFVIFGEGLDSWDLGITSKENYKEKYLAFRENYRKDEARKNN